MGFSASAIGGTMSTIIDIRLLEFDVTSMGVGAQKKIARIRDHYEGLGGPSYDIRYREEQESKYTLALRFVQIADWDVVLDLGCGTGLFLQKHTIEAGFVVGLDMSASLLSTAKSGLEGRTGVSFVLSDAHHLPLKAAIFSRIFVFTIVQNSPTPVSLLCEASRVLKLSGELVVSGLRKAFDKDGFLALLQASGLVVTHFIEENLYDYLAVCVAGRPLNIGKSL